MEQPKTLQELFSKDDSWLQSFDAQDQKGYYCNPNDPDVVRWCLYGGICKVYKGDDVKKISDKIKNKLMLPIVFCNDTKERTIDHIRQLVKELNI